MASGVSGPELEDLRDRMKDWYAKTRLSYIEAFEETYPYGSRPLSNIEQVSQFLEVLQGPGQFAAIMASLYERYRGLPDASQRVQNDINAYINDMRSKLIELQGVRSV